MCSRKLKSGDGFSVGDELLPDVSIAEALGIAAPAGRGGKEKHKEEAGHSGAKAGAPAAAIPRVSLQCQRAGRGGKTVTLVLLPQDWRGDRKELAQELRRGLGCGSSMEGDTIVLQGDIAERAAAWFGKKGVKKIKVG